MDLKSLIRHARVTFKEDAAIEAGRHAENLVGLYLSHVLQKQIRGARVWHDIRIPRAEGYGKYEIDYLVLTPHGALVLEVKNFGGSIEAEAKTGRWLQTTSTKHKKTHECPLSLAQKKVAALVIFLNRKGVACREEDFQLRLVLVNSRLRLTKQLSSDPRICAIPKLKNSFHHLLPKQRGFLGLGRSRPRFPAFTAICRACDLLPTWDEIELYGGKILRGDILKNLKSTLPTRAQTKSVTVLIPRHPFWGRLHPSLFFYRLRNATRFHIKMTRATPLDQTVTMHEAGQREPIEVKMINIKRIRYGSDVR